MGGQHTPGPLTVTNEHSSSRLFQVLDAGGDATASYCGLGDATLYAAAPALLEAARRSEALLAYLLNAADADGCIELDRAEASDFPDLLTEVRAAIAAATHPASLEAE